MEREKLADLVIRFTEAFNREDLDGVMSFMADDAVYDEFNGTVNRGAGAIRAAFGPQFRGDYGKLRFHTEDLFVGLDILHVENGRITEKLTYAKARVPLLGDTP